MVQEDQEFKATLSYIVNSGLAWSYEMAVKTLACKALVPEFDLQDPQDVSREPISTSFSITLTALLWHSNTHTNTHTHT